MGAGFASSLPASFYAPPSGPICASCEEERASCRYSDDGRCDECTAADDAPTLAVALLGFVNAATVAT